MTDEMDRLSVPGRTFSSDNNVIKLLLFIQWNKPFHNSQLEVVTMFDLAFWTASLERALKTVAQALVALIGANAVSIMSLDWAQMLGVAATAGVVSVLTSLASAPFGNTGPSLANEAALEPDGVQ